MEQQKTLLDLHDDWVGLVERGWNNYDSLTRDEKVWFNVQGLIGDVGNGGLISHYYNTGAARNTDTIEDLRYLGCDDIADLLSTINTLFPNGQPPKALEHRNEIISSWADGQYDDLLDKLDERFFQREKDLEERLVEHVLKSGLSR